MFFSNNGVISLPLRVNQLSSSMAASLKPQSHFPRSGAGTPRTADPDSSGLILGSPWVVRGSPLQIRSRSLEFRGVPGSSGSILVRPRIFLNCLKHPGRFFRSWLNRGVPGVFRAFPGTSLAHPGYSVGGPSCAAVAADLTRPTNSAFTFSRLALSLFSFVFLCDWIAASALARALATALTVDERLLRHWPSTSGCSGLSAIRPRSRIRTWIGYIATSARCALNSAVVSATDYGLQVINIIYFVKSIAFSSATSTNNHVLLE